MENEKTGQNFNMLTKRSSNYMPLKHMKSLIVLVVGLLFVGCLTPEQKQQEALRDSVVGEYEYKHRSGTISKVVFLEKDIVEFYLNDKKQEDAKWSIVKGEIHVKYPSGYIQVYRINKDKSITMIAIIDGDAKREDWPKERQSTSIKIK